MKVSELQEVIDNIPRSVAIFAVTRPPKWATERAKVKKGDLVYYNEIGCFTTLRYHNNLALTASHVDFLRYEEINKCATLRQP